MTTTSDLVYGRQGGRFIGDHQSAGVSLTQIHRLRLDGIAAGTWPDWADQDWHDRAAEALRAGDTTGPAVRAIETARALTKAGRGPHPIPHVASKDAAA